MTTTYTSLQQLVESSIATLGMDGAVIVVPISPQSIAVTISATEMKTEINGAGVTFPLTLSSSIARTLEDSIARNVTRGKDRHVAVNVNVDVATELRRAKDVFYSTAPPNAPPAAPLGDPMPGFEDEYQLQGAFPWCPTGPGTRPSPGFGSGDVNPFGGAPGMHPTADDPLFRPSGGPRGAGSGGGAGSGDAPYARWDDPFPPL
jgi:hypothetical protein